jgi:hypothetical protein
VCVSEAFVVLCTATFTELEVTCTETCRKFSPRIIKFVFAECKTTGSVGDFRGQSVSCFAFVLVEDVLRWILTVRKISVRNSVFFSPYVTSEKWRQCKNANFYRTCFESVLVEIIHELINIPKFL